MIIAKALEKCTACQGACDKKLPVIKGDILYVVPYGSEDADILSRRGSVVYEVACMNGDSELCDIYVRSFFTLYDKLVVTIEYASGLLGRTPGNYEKFSYQGKTFIATSNPCDIRVSQELQ